MNRSRCTSVFVLMCALVTAATHIGCVPPASFRQVKQPRAGEAVGQRVCIVYSQRYQIDLGGVEKLHPFDINKYAKIYLALLTEGLVQPEDVFVPEPARRVDLLRVHTAEYLDQRLRHPASLARYLEFDAAAIVPAGFTDAAVLKAFRAASGGTLTAARLAVQYGMAVNLGGGYHHAEPDAGGGFCIYADMPMAIRTLQAEGLIERALIVDLDAHQGNGTAMCLADDDSVFTFDMHQEGIYPNPKQRNDLDIPLSAGTTDAEYLALLGRRLPSVFDAADPDLVILQAGADVLDEDPLAGLSLTPEGVRQRDEMVFEAAASRNVPIVMVLGGGYSANAWRVQFESIRNLILKYGTSDGGSRHPRRIPTTKEKVYTK